MQTFCGLVLVLDVLCDSPVCFARYVGRMPSLLSPPDDDFVALRSLLQDILNRLIEDVGLLERHPSGEDRIDSRISEIARRAVADWGKFQSTDDHDEAIRVGSRVMGELARGMADVAPLARGVLADYPKQARPDIERVLSIAERARQEHREWRQLTSTYSAREDAQKAAREALSAASALKTAAGDEGATKLEESFVAFANGERKSAQAFRFWTITLLCVVAVLGGLLVIVQAFVPGQTEIPWQGVVYRVTLLTALAGLAAYLGRQSGNHRRAATWADAIAVQLKAFPAFIQPIQGGKVADELYEAFGRRVMGSPPDFAGKSDDATNPTMTALIDALVKQARPTT